MNDSSIDRSKFFPDLRDVNLGVVLIGSYLLFDFGCIQGVFDFINALKLPYILALSSLLYAFFLIVSGKTPFTYTTYIFSFLIAFILVYIQIATINREEAWGSTTQFLQYWANYIILISCVKKPSQYILLLDIFILAVMHSSFRSIRSQGRIFDSLWLADENTVGLLMAYAMPFAFFLFIYYKSWIKKIYYILGLVAMVAANVVAMSRGGTLALAIAGFFCWLFIKYKFRTLFLIIMAVVLIFQFAPPKFFSEMNSLKQGTEEGTAFDRVYSWHLAFMMFLDHPILGIGPANYPHYFSQYNLIYKEISTRNPGHKAREKRVAHSTPYQWLAEMGFIGVCILLLLQVAMFKNWWTLRKYTETIKYSPEKSEEFLFFKYLTHANALGQIAFWIGALFLTLILQPFYWILIPFSECCKNLLVNFMEEEPEEPSISIHDPQQQIA
jgi:oligosaccharide repeat unit polymerase